MSYVELHTHSYYSLLDGVPSPEDLVRQAADLDMPALALTDHDALYGAPRFVRAAEQAGIKPILGAELTLTNGGSLTLLAENDTGYANLCQLITLARRDQPKGTSTLPWRRLADFCQGLIALSGSRSSELSRALFERDNRLAGQVAGRYAAIFGRHNFFLEIQRHHERHDRWLNDSLVDLAHKLGLRVAATGNVHYLSSNDAPLHDVLTCIRHRQPLDSANDSLLRSNAEYYFRSPQEMARLFAWCPDALQATRDVAARCNVRLPAGPQAFPHISVSDVTLQIEQLRYLCQRALDQKTIPSGARAAYQATLDREMNIIDQQNLAGYFLVVWDLVRFARSLDILCQGRGSAANSLVAYLLDITAIDPLSAGLVFERFLSPERVAPPDIDLDVASNRREEVIQYLYRRYGRDHAAMACTVVTFGARQALRDVGMVLGFSEVKLDEICRHIDVYSAGSLFDSAGLQETLGEQLESPRWQQLLGLAAALDNFPRHLGIHNGGMVLCHTQLTRQIPVEPASMEDRTVVQWDKDALEMAGWVKLDVLGLRMLSAVSDACDMIARATGRRPDLPALPPDDSRVYDMLCRGETMGVFQVESRAQTSLIPRFQPRSITDLTIEIALIRPGPIQGKMVHPYLRRRDGIEQVRYAHPLLEPALEETLGVIMFQEQVLKVARDLAGFSPGQGEMLRRALSHKRATQEIEKFHDSFLEGALKNDVPLETARDVFELLRAFGGFSFSKAHAASFAVITYWSAWLRCYFPSAFFAGLLRHQPMGFYPKHVVVSDALRVGVEFLPVDLRYSHAEVTLEGNAIRLGLNYLKGFGPQQVDLLEVERRRSAFRSLNDLVKRTHLERRHAETLVLSGALDFLGERRQLLWDLEEAYRLAPRQSLSLKSVDERVRLPAMSRQQRMVSAFGVTGVSLDGHLSELRRDAFIQAGALPIDQLDRVKHGQPVRIGGLVVARQRPPSAKGMCFLSIQDSGGMANVIVSPKLYARYREAINGVFVVVDGVVEKKLKAINVVADRITRI